MIFNAITTVGILLSLAGAVKLFLSTPTIYGDRSWAGLRVMPERAGVVRGQRRAWLWIVLGFFLQFVGSLAWLWPLVLELAERP